MGLSAATIVFCQAPYGAKMPNGGPTLARGSSFRRGLEYLTKANGLHVDRRRRSTTSELETLKALRESVSQRWERRREYEWKLSFALWTAIAAFIGIAIGKENTLKDVHGVVQWIIIAGLTITGLHAFYLFGIISNTLDDLQKLTWLEEVMHATLPAGVLELEKGWPKNATWPDPQKGAIVGTFVKYHGFVIQPAITFVLCACALGAIVGPKR